MTNHEEEEFDEEYDEYEDEEEEEDDSVDIGDVRHGHVVVCHGDDYPYIFARWLEPLVDEFKELSGTAEQYRLDLRIDNEDVHLHNVTAFCNRLGVSFSTKAWTGSLISGLYRVGWVKVGEEEKAATRGREFVDRLKLLVESGVRVADDAGK